MQDIKGLDESIRVARGERPADLVLKNARLVNVFSAEIHDADVAVYQGRISGLGAYRGKAEIDLKRAYLSPGFIDSHLHLESSKLLPQEYAGVVVPKGTTAVVIDPHEIANVLGLRGIRFMLDSTLEGPLSVFLMLSSCVPATDLETSGARLSASDLAPLLADERVLGIAELMNYPALLAGAPEVLEKVELGIGKRVNGHAPGLTGKELCAYVGAGIRSEHECSSMEEAREKLRLGMHIMIREGSAAKNLADLLPLVNASNARRFLFATDDRSPEDLADEGHLDFILRKAIRAGLDPALAIQMATINAASYFGLEELGAIAPGYRADMVVIGDLKEMEILKVFKAGRLVAEQGRLLAQPKRAELPEGLSSMNVDWSGLQRLPVRVEGDYIKVIELIPRQILNRRAIERAKAKDGLVVPDLERDILKLAVIERHRASGNVGVGFVRGFGLRGGALGSSVAHDSHNIVVVGTSDEEIKSAAHEVARIGGGQVVVLEGKRLAALPLEVAGLMSERPVDEVVEKARALKSEARRLGCRLDDPFMALSFVALPVVPEIRLTDRGLVDVKKFDFVPLFGQA